MKSLLVLAALVFTSQAMASDYLVRKQAFSGFGPKPTQWTLTITIDGKATVVSKSVTDNKQSKTVKTLSPNEIQSIKDNVDAINPKAEVVDLDEGKPRCMDAPSSSYYISVKGKDVQFAARNSCHSFQMKSAAAASLLKKVQEVETKFSK